MTGVSTKVKHTKTYSSKMVFLCTARGRGRGRGRGRVRVRVARMGFPAGGEAGEGARRMLRESVCTTATVQWESVSHRAGCYSAVGVSVTVSLTARAVTVQWECLSQCLSPRGMLSATENFVAMIDSRRAVATSIRLPSWGGMRKTVRLHMVMEKRKKRTFRKYLHTTRQGNNKATGRQRQGSGKATNGKATAGRHESATTARQQQRSKTATRGGRSKTDARTTAGDAPRADTRNGQRTQTATRGQRASVSG